MKFRDLFENKHKNYIMNSVLDYIVSTQETNIEAYFDHNEGKETPSFKELQKIFSKMTRFEMEEDAMLEWFEFQDIMPEDADISIIDKKMWDKLMKEYIKSEEFKETIEEYS